MSEGIVLENLDFKAMTGQALKNLWQLLNHSNPNAKIISNSYLEVKIRDIEVIDRDNYIEGLIKDIHDNALIIFFYSYDWVENNESLFSVSEYIVSIMPNKNDSTYPQFKQTHGDGNIIQYDQLKKLYVGDYKKKIIEAVRDAAYGYNVEEYIKKLINRAKTTFIHNNTTEYWVAPPNKHGFFIISKK